MKSSLRPLFPAEQMLSDRIFVGLCAISIFSGVWSLIPQLLENQIEASAPVIMGILINVYFFAALALDRKGYKLFARSATSAVTTAFVFAGAYVSAPAMHVDTILVFLAPINFLLLIGFPPKFRLFFAILPITLYMVILIHPPQATQFQAYALSEHQQLIARARNLTLGWSVMLFGTASIFWILKKSERDWTTLTEQKKNEIENEPLKQKALSIGVLLEEHVQQLEKDINTLFETSNSKLPHDSLNAIEQRIIKIGQIADLNERPIESLSK